LGRRAILEMLARGGAILGSAIAVPASVGKKEKNIEPPAICLWIVDWLQSLSNCLAGLSPVFVCNYLIIAQKELGGK